MLYLYYNVCYHDPHPGTLIFSPEVVCFVFCEKYSMFREIFRHHETEYLPIKEKVFVVQNCYINLRIKC
jgi:hypothetical protein